METTASAPKEIFIAYAQRDHDIVMGVVDLLQTSGVNISTHKIEQKNPGSGKLLRADIVLLMISPDFLNSDYCYSPEMIQVIAQHNQGFRQVLPILLRPIYWEKTSFGHLQALPHNAQPITTQQAPSQALQEVVESVRAIANDKTAVMPNTKVLPSHLLKRQDSRPPAPGDSPQRGEDLSPPDGQESTLPTPGYSLQKGPPMSDNVSRRNVPLVRVSVMVVVILMAGGVFGVLFYRNQQAQFQANAMATAQIQQANATGTTQAQANASAIAQTTATRTATPPRVLITSPADGSIVDMGIIVQGTAYNIPNDEELWVLVVPDSVNIYYPQPGPVVIRGNIWSSSTTIGVPSDHGLGFTLIVALADQHGSAVISDYLQQSNQTGVYKGIYPLPQGVVLQSRVHVTRN